MLCGDLNIHPNFKGGSVHEKKSAIKLTLCLIDLLAASLMHRQMRQYLMQDFIHPTSAASKRMAELIWQNMVQNNMEIGEDCRGF